MNFSTSFFGLAFLIVSLLLASACIAASTGEASSPQIVTQTVITCPDCPLVDVTRVIDGDTIEVERLDGSGKPIRVRLWGIDTPEMANADRAAEAQPLADEARRFTRAACFGQVITLEVQPHRLHGKYQRLLAYVKLKDGSVLNERLLEAGLATADDRFPHKHFERYELHERQAKYDRVGLWSRHLRAARAKARR